MAWVIHLTDLGPVHSTVRRNVNVRLESSISCISKNFIETGFSRRWLDNFDSRAKASDFSGEGLSHNELAAQIVKQAKLGENVEGEFALVFAAMGVTHDTADFSDEHLKKVDNGSCHFLLKHDR